MTMTLKNSAQPKRAAQAGDNDVAGVLSLIAITHSPRHWKSCIFILAYSLQSPIVSAIYFRIDLHTDMNAKKGTSWPRELKLRII